MACDSGRTAEPRCSAGGGFKAVILRGEVCVSRRWSPLRPVDVEIDLKGNELNRAIRSKLPDDRVSA